jgi:hypothetical protein
MTIEEQNWAQLILIGLVTSVFIFWAPVVYVFCWFVTR